MCLTYLTEWWREQNEEVDTKNIIWKVKIIILLRPIPVSVVVGHILSFA